MQSSVCHFRQNPRYCYTCSRHFCLLWCGLHNQTGRQSLLLLHSHPYSHIFLVQQSTCIMLISIPFSSSSHHLASPGTPSHTKAKTLHQSLAILASHGPFPTCQTPHALYPYLIRNTSNYWSNSPHSLALLVSHKPCTSLHGPLQHLTFVYQNGCAYLPCLCTFISKFTNNFSLFHVPTSL